MVQVVDCRETDNRADILIERAQRKASEIRVLQVSGAGTPMDNKEEGGCQSVDRRDIFPQQGMPGRIQGESYKIHSFLPSDGQGAGMGDNPGSADAKGSWRENRECHIRWRPGYHKGSQVCVPIRHQTALPGAYREGMPVMDNAVPKDFGRNRPPQACAPDKRHRHAQRREVLEDAAGKVAS